MIGGMKVQKRSWFKNKRYGYGWVPASWEGWLVLLIYIVLLAHILRNISLMSDAGRLEGTWVVVAIGRVVFLTLALFLVCLLKGEKLAWHWGEKSRQVE